jgi:hypothetical protein
MAVVRTGCFRDGFTIRDFRFVEFDRQFIIVLDSPFQRTKMEFSLAGNDRLLQFLGLFDHPRRILFTHTHQDFHHFFSICFINRLHGTTIFRVRIFDKVETIIASLTIQCVTTTNILQLNGSTDISGNHFGHGVTGLSGNREQLRDTLLRTTIGIQQIVTFFYLT